MYNVFNWRMIYIPNVIVLALSPHGTAWHLVIQNNQTIKHIFSRLLRLSPISTINISGIAVKATFTWVYPAPRKWVARRRTVWRRSSSSSPPLFLFVYNNSVHMKFSLARRTELRFIQGLRFKEQKAQKLSRRRNFNQLFMSVVLLLC